MEGNFENIPTAMAAGRHWVTHSDKKPCDQRGKGISWPSVNLWLTLPEALERWRQHPGEIDGIGWIIAREPELGDKQIIGGDLDCCRDPVTGQASAWALERLKELNAHTEISFSGCGFRWFAFGKLPGGLTSTTGEGPDDLTPEMKIHILAAKPTAREKLEKGVNPFNNFEIYEGGSIVDGKVKNGRHLTVTGQCVEGFPKELEDRTSEIISTFAESINTDHIVKWMNALPEGGDGVKPEADHTPDPLKEMKAHLAGDRESAFKILAGLNITRVIDCSGFKEEGGQLFGPHPTLNSTTGKNLVVDPNGNQWAYMHNAINSGGGPIEWLAAESGAIRIEDCRRGCLRGNREAALKTLEHAVSRGFLSREEIHPPREIKTLANVPNGASIVTVCLENPPGSVGLAKDGTVCAVQVDDKDSSKRNLKWVSDCPVYIDIETAADSETEFTFRGEGAKDHRRACFTLPAAALADDRKFRAALINAFGAANRVGRLSFETVQRMTRNTKRMRRIEVPDWDGNIPLLPGVGLASDVEFRLSPKTPAMVYNGDLETAKGCLRALLGLHKYAPILVTGIMGAPAYARWHKNDRFGVALWGLTGTLKTSVIQMALSMYGVGYADDEAILKHGKAGSTQVGMLEVFASAGFLPQLLDNVKAVDDRDTQQYISIIHAVLEGADKVRGRKDGGLRDSRNFSSCPIITGEIRPEEASTSARVLNLTWTRPDDIKLGYVQSNVPTMPGIGYHWLKFLAETDLNLVDGFSEARSKKMAEFSQKHYVNPGRLATIYTLLRSTWGLLCESPLGDVFREFSEGFVSALDDAIQAQGVMVSEETELEKFMAGLRELLASNPGLIQGIDGKTLLGRVIGKWTDKGLFLLPNETLAELTKSKVFTQKPTEDSITNALHSGGWLVVGESGRLKTQLRMNGTKTRGWLLSPGKFLLSPLPGDAKNDNGGPNVPEVPTVPNEKRENNFEVGIKDVSEEKKQEPKSGGYNGYNGYSITDNTVIDSGFDGSKSVPDEVPGKSGTGDIERPPTLAGLERVESVPPLASGELTALAWAYDSLKHERLKATPYTLAERVRSGKALEIPLKRCEAWLVGRAKA